MAEFVKKGAKGAVGRLTKAETMDKDGYKSAMSMFNATLPEDIETLTEDIRQSHKAALGEMGRAVLAAARAGKLLLAAKVKLPKDKPFTDWLAETFEFSQRTAYNYMKVAEAMALRASEIEKCESIRDVLKLCDAEDGKKKKKDEKRESVITWTAKIERWWADEIAAMPLEDWPAERRSLVKKHFAAVARMHAEL